MWPALDNEMETVMGITWGQKHEAAGSQKKGSTKQKLRQAWTASKKLMFDVLSHWHLRVVCHCILMGMVHIPTETASIVNDWQNRRTGWLKCAANKESNFLSTPFKALQALHQKKKSITTSPVSFPDLPFLPSRHTGYLKYLEHIPTTSTTTYWAPTMCHAILSTSQLSSHPKHHSFAPHCLYLARPSSVLVLKHPT